MNDFFSDPKYTIETDRLILRPPAEQDFPDLAKMMADEETAKFIGGVQDPANAWRSMAMLLGHWQIRGYGFFSVIEKTSSQWIGRVGPWYPHLWPEPEVGWTICRSHWRKGFAKEAAIATIDWTFAHLNWSQVTHCIDPENIGSQKVAQSIGSKPIRMVDELPGFGPMEIVIWGQSQEQWNKTGHGKMKK